MPLLKGLLWKPYGWIFKLHHAARSHIFSKPSSRKGVRVSVLLYVNIHHKPHAVSSCYTQVKHRNARFYSLLLPSYTCHSWEFLTTSLPTSASAVLNPTSNPDGILRHTVWVCLITESYRNKRDLSAAAAAIWFQDPTSHLKYALTSTTRDCSTPTAPIKVTVPDRYRNTRECEAEQSGLLLHGTDSRYRCFTLERFTLFNQFLLLPLRSASLHLIRCQ